MSSKAGIELPAGYSAKSLSDVERFNGTLLRAENPQMRSGVTVSAIPRTPLTDTGAIARGIAATIAARTDDAKTSRDEVTEINGLRALRFEVEATNRGMYGSRYTYILTVIEGATEIVVVNAYGLTLGIKEDRHDLQQIAFGIQGIGNVQAPATAANQGPSSAEPAERSSAVVDVRPIAQPVALDTSAATTTSPKLSERPVQSSVADRLRDLEQVCKEGIVGKKDCDDKKRELLKAL